MGVNGLTGFVNNKFIIQPKDYNKGLQNRHSLMLLWFADLMNVTEEVKIHRLQNSCMIQLVVCIAFTICKMKICQVL